MSSRRKSRKRSAAARSARPRPATRPAAPASTGTPAGDGQGTAPAADDGQGTDKAATAGSGPGAGRGGRKAGREADRKKAAVAGNRTYAGADTRAPRAAGGPARTPVGAGAAARTAPRSAALVAAAAPTAIGAATLTAPQVPFDAEAVTAPAPEAAPESAPESVPVSAPYVSEAAPPAPAPAPIPAPDLGLPADATPDDAFDALYRHAAGALLRQVDLLTGDASQARRSVAYAYDLAWQRWPEVARDSDPVGWLRAAAYDHALAPWQRWVPAWAGGHRTRPRTPDDPLAAALLTLRPTQRKALLLHDGLGLDLPAAAAEVEASEEAAAARIIAARETLTEAVPDLAEEVLPARLGALLDGGAVPDSGPDSGPGADAGPGGDSGSNSGSVAEPPDLPDGVRAASERGARHRTVGAYALTAAIAAATTVAVILTPAHQSAHRARQSGPGAHAPARTGDRPGPAQQGGAGPLPSGK
ncbi:hypothetical protein AB0399_39970, partial [Streptomyces sp. NPDC088194]|uniref:hypothetical protein n=1 Tax=Streptomyces sp. NPDC088194 TaxID=3154931 RepID=UPI00344D99F9